MKLCVNCGINPIKYPGCELCSTCYRYEKQHGHPRPKRLADRQYDLNQRRKLDMADKLMVREMWLQGFSKTFLSKYWHIAPKTLRVILGLDT